MVPTVLMTLLTIIYFFLCRHIINLIQNHSETSSNKNKKIIQLCPFLQGLLLPVRFTGGGMR